eukprot:gene21508-biopygen30221
MSVSLDRLLLESSRDGDVNAAVSALELGADVDCRDLDAPLHRAARNGHLECIKALLDRGAEVNIKCNVGSTPLHSAAFYGRVECTRALLERGAEVNTQDNNGNAPLHFAAWNGYLECMKALLDSGAEVDAQDNNGSTPLHDAARGGHVECIKALLDSSAEVDAQDNDGSTPLHDAAQQGHVECIKDLLVSGARVTIMDTCGLTAFDKALEHGHQDGANAIRSNIRRSEQPAKNLSVNQRTENEKLRNHLDESRAKIDEYEVYRACMTGKEEVIASQDLDTLERLLATVDLGCLTKAVLEKRVQREVDKARNIATECGICLSVPKDTCLHPCGHTMCRSCSDLIQLCPICRQTIAERRRVFL